MTRIANLVAQPRAAWLVRQGPIDSAIAPLARSVMHHSEGYMGKFFAITMIVIAIFPRFPSCGTPGGWRRTFPTHGQPIDEQMSETMAEAGISFLASQIILALFIWKFSNPKPGDKVKNFPGGAKAMVWAAFLLVGTEVLALGFSESKPGLTSISRPRPPMRYPCRYRQGNLPFTSAILGQMGHFGPTHPEMISEANENITVLTPTTIRMRKTTS